MLKRSLRLTLAFVGAAVAVLAGLLILAGLRLSQGPVSLDFLTPALERNLSTEDTRVRVSGTTLAWGGWERTLDIHLSGVRVTGPQGGEKAFVPDMSVSLSLRAMLRGRLAPTRLELYAPRLVVVRRPDGSFGFGDAVPAGGQEGAAAEQGRLGGDITARVVERLVGPPDYAGPLGYLTSISLLNADFVLDDQRAGVILRAPGSNIVLVRDEDGLGGNASLAILAAGQRTNISLSGDYRLAEKALDLQARFGSFEPASFAPLAPSLAPLSAVKLPISGEVSLRLSTGGKVDALAVNLKAGAGTIEAPELFDGPVTVRSAALAAAAGEGLARLDIQELTADLGGPVLALSGTARRGEDGRVTATLETEVQDVTAEDLKRLWPKGAAPGGREWVVENVEKGSVSGARLTAEITARDDGTGGFADAALARMEGSFDFSGLTVHFLRPLPPVIGISGRGSFHPTSLDFEATSGNVGNLRVSEAKVHLRDLDTDTELMDVEFAASGPVAEVAQLLAHPRLDLLKELDLDPAKVAGTGAFRLRLDFPLRKDLDIEHMKIAASARLQNLALPGVAMDNDLTDGDLTLRLDERSMNVKGTARIAGAPAELAWTEHFEDGAGFRSRYAVKAVIDDAARANLDLDFLAPYLQGPMGADLVITRHDAKRMTLAGTFDVKETRIDARDYGWSKPAGVSGFVRLSMVMENDKMKVIESLTAKAGDLDVSGAITFAPDGTSVSSFEFGRLAYAETDLRLRGHFREDGGLVLNAIGAKADIRPFLADSGGEEPPMPLDLTVDLGVVRAAPNAVISRVKGRLVRDKVDWRQMDVVGYVGEGTPLTMRIAPDEKGVRRLRIQSDDAGAALKAVDITDNMVGGTLNIEGQFDDSKPLHPLTGHMAVRKFRMMKTPFLAKLLAVASLTGILDTLTGKGIAFERLDAPFVKAGPRLTLKDARAHGSAIGFTAEGTLDLEKDTMDLSGTVVPAYTLNSVFGDIPLLGQLLVPEKGSGLFAATYSMRGPIEDPNVAVNPLATLTPGFLRGLFNIFDAPKAPEPAPQEPPPAVPQGAPGGEAPGGAPAEAPPAPAPS